MTLCNYKDPLSQAIELDRPRWEMMEAIQIHTYGEPEGTKRFLASHRVAPVPISQLIAALLGGSHVIS